MDQKPSSVRERFHNLYETFWTNRYPRESSFSDNSSVHSGLSGKTLVPPQYRSNPPSRSHPDQGQGPSENRHRNHPSEGYPVHARSRSGTTRHGMDEPMYDHNDRYVRSTSKHERELSMPLALVASKVVTHSMIICKRRTWREYTC